MITQNWGIIDYNEAVEKQLREVADVVAGAEDRLIFCTHPPIVTLGRGTKPGDLISWQGQTIEVSRGGRATYHGPSQVVVYPIINLTIDRKNFGPRDIRAYLECLGLAIVETLQHFNISSEYRSLATSDGPSVTGVWVGQKKIASIGVAVKKWISYHGIAVNLEKDPAAFSGINPCGFSSNIMTSVEDCLGARVSREDFSRVLNQNLTTSCDQL